MTGLLPVEDAVARIVGAAAPLSAEPVPLAEALGRRLAAPVAATRAQPPFPASAMDGYAVRSVDAHPGARLTVVGVAAAGHRFAGAVEAGTAVRIFTGAAVPDGADAILIQENADAVDPATVQVREGVAAGRHIRRAGLDFRPGDTLLPAGRIVRAREIALAAATGFAELPVRRRPRVAVLGTGDELVSPGEQPGDDQIFASNTFAVGALVEEAGGIPIDLGLVPDSRRDIERAVDRAIEAKADVLVPIGGASVGDHDLVRQALEAKGMVLGFWRIAMRPGKPLMFGHIGGMLALGLPGNPVSAIVCAVVFLRPLIARLLGAPLTDPTEPAILDVPVRENDMRQDYLRAVLKTSHESTPRVRPLPIQDSAMLSTLAEADCLLVRPPLAPAAAAGEPCRIIRLT